MDFTNFLTIRGLNLLPLQAKLASTTAGLTLELYMILLFMLFVVALTTNCVITVTFHYFIVLIQG